MKVLSLFDGLGGARQALKELDIKVVTYLASEIDKYAITVCKKNQLDIIHIGDINSIDYTLYNKYGPFDLIIGGSPCQDLSIAKNNRKGLQGVRSGLFWKMANIIEEFKPKYFLVENVASMSKESKNTITEILKIEPILINSALLTAQSRKRLYWTNIPNVTQPDDKKIYLKDIIQTDVDEKYFYSDKAISYLDRNKINKRFVVHKDDTKAKFVTANFQKSIPYNVYVDREKSNCITSTYANRACICYNKSRGQIVFYDKPVKLGNLGDTDSQGNRVYATEGKSVSISANGGGGGAKTGLYVVKNNIISKERTSNSPEYYQRHYDKILNSKEPLIVSERGRRLTEDGKKRDDKNGKVFRGIEVCSDIKSNCLSTVQKDNLLANNNAIRRLTPIECERLQGLPDNYTEGVSDTQRYKMVGNGFTIPIIKHILSFMEV